MWDLNGLPTPQQWNSTDQKVEQDKWQFMVVKFQNGKILIHRMHFDQYQASSAVHTIKYLKPSRRHFRISLCDDEYWTHSSETNEIKSIKIIFVWFIHYLLTILSTLLNNIKKITNDCGEIFKTDTWLQMKVHHKLLKSCELPYPPKNCWI